GNSGSWVRLTYFAGHYTGLFFDGVQLYAMEPAAVAGRFSAAAAAMDPTATVIYRMADTRITGMLFDGDTVATSRSGADTFDQIAAELPPATAAAVLTTRRLDVGVVVDPELALIDGASATANVVTRMNTVDGIFSTQVGVHLQLLSTTILDGASPPFSSNDASTLLDQLRAYRTTSAVEQGNGLTHLFTGRNLDGNTVGIAYISSICNDRFAASLSEVRGGGFDALVAAHEIGHTFGAPHDGDTDPSAPACAAASPTTFLMAPQVNGSQTFSDCSLQEIAKKVATASCLAPIDAADAALGASLNASLALNQPTTVAFNVRSVGTIAVNDVIVEVNLPPSVIAAGAGAEAGTCDVQSNRIVCNLGSLPPGQTRAIEMSLLGNSIGQTNAFLSVTASNDGLAPNNNSTLRLNTAAGADLTVSVTSPQLDVIVGQTSTATITLRNLGLADAADAQLTALFPAGLVPTSLTTNGISCTLDAAGFTCPAGLLAVTTEATLTVGLRGTVVGNQRLTLSLRSSLPDPQPGNNDAGITFRVAEVPPPPPTPPTGSGSNGGGGSLGIGLLLWLAALGGLARGRSQTRRESL
ncbi:MAG TPA: M12 family metallo-peptidase, partial [Steroidobacteraceae bacterium]|nr:M12 family metallo-peptidase [Steroidobacteraceae bacterium]